MFGALSHIRVLDLSRILAGPWASQTLGDLGAEIIKIERPGRGDDTRQWGPPYVKDAKGKATNDAAYFMSANRNKKSVAIDMAKPEGQKLLHGLVLHCDVVIENFKVGGLKKYNLDYDCLKAIKPDLVYCSVTGFGQDGPYAGLAGYDFLIQGMGGLMSITGQPDGVDGGGPMKVGVALADVLTGLYGVIGVQAALAYRDKTGEGQHIDLALLDVQVATLANQALNYLASGEAPARLGNAHPNIVPYQTFATSDGHMILAVGNDGQFVKFCELAGIPEIATDERFKTNAARVKNRAILTPLLQARIETRPLDWWLGRLNEQAVPCGPINTIERVFDDPQVKHRGMQQSLEHPIAGSVPSVASPLKFSKTPAVCRSAPPTLGQHTDQILGSLLGLNPAQLARLKADKITG